MNENFTRDIQKFINTPFKPSALYSFIDRKKDFLLKSGIIDNCEKNQYNAMWDVLCDLESYYNFLKGHSDNLACLTNDLSIEKMYKYNLIVRTYAVTDKDKCTELINALKGDYNGGNS
jgi:hypothetical protein